MDPLLLADSMDYYHHHNPAARSLLRQDLLETTPSEVPFRQALDTPLPFHSLPLLLKKLLPFDLPCSEYSLL